MDDDIPQPGPGEVRVRVLAAGVSFSDALLRAGVFYIWKGAPMPKASKASASESIELEGYEGHFQDFGPYTVGFETYTADAELAPLFVGLPDDRCQCPHMGYVVEGRVKFTFADGHEEIYEEGDAYYAPPGHLPTLYAGSQVVEFSPTTELQQTMAVVDAENSRSDPACAG